MLTSAKDITVSSHAHVSLFLSFTQALTSQDSAAQVNPRHAIVVTPGAVFVDIIYRRPSTWVVESVAGPG